MANCSALVAASRLGGRRVGSNRATEQALIETLALQSDDHAISAPPTATEIAEAAGFDMSLIRESLGLSCEANPLTLAFSDAAVEIHVKRHHLNRESFDCSHSVEFVEWPHEL